MLWLILGVFFSILVFIILAAKVYLILTVGRCDSKMCLLGKTVIVTGANTGIGYETALDLAGRGAKVILACRDLKKAEEARNQIIYETNNNNVVVKLLDCSSLKSVRKFAKDIIENEKRLDVLVNNAGVGGLNEKFTEDGLELTMQINHFSNFLLTNLLLGLLKKSAPSRIVNVSSIAAKYAKLNVNNLNKHPGRTIVYCNSKLCNILFTKELAQRLQGTGVTAYSLHPGAVNTEIFRRVRGSLKAIFDPVKRLYFKTSEEGAQTTIYLAVTKNIEGLSGGHFEDCKLVRPYRTVKSTSLAKDIWEKSEQLVKEKEE